MLPRTTNGLPRHLRACCVPACSGRDILTLFGSLAVLTGNDRTTLTTKLILDNLKSFLALKRTGSHSRVSGQNPVARQLGLLRYLGAPNT